MAPQVGTPDARMLAEEKVPSSAKVAKTHFEGFSMIEPSDVDDRALVRNISQLAEAARSSDPCGIFLILGRTNHALDDVCSRCLRQLVFTSDCRRTAEGQISVARILHGGPLLRCPVHARRRRGMGTWQGCYERRD